MGRQRQEHPVPSGSCVQGEILHTKGVESRKYAGAWKGGEDMTDGWTGRGERRGRKSETRILCMDVEGQLVMRETVLGRVEVGATSWDYRERQ